MQKNLNRNQAKNSSLFQFVQSLFQGKPVQAQLVYTHPTYLAQQAKKKCVTINVSDLSPEQRASYDALFANLFSSNQIKTA